MVLPGQYGLETRFATMLKEQYGIGMQWGVHFVKKKTYCVDDSIFTVIAEKALAG